MTMGPSGVLRHTRPLILPLADMALAIDSFCTIKTRVVHIWCPHRLHRARCSARQAQRAAARGDPRRKTVWTLARYRYKGMEQVIQCYDTHSGLSAIISIHTT